MDPDVVAALHLRYAEELGYFILGVVRDREITQEVVQTAFAKVIELGHTVKPGSLKSWLFKVAYNEALALRRRQAVGDKATRRLADQLPEGCGPPGGTGSPEVSAAVGEAITAVRAALTELPAEQRQVVSMRVYQQKKFAEIAEELQLPLGTVLSRMQLALAKLRRSLGTFAE